MFPLGISKQNRFSGILWWAMDYKIRGRDLDPATFTSNLMRKSLTSFEDYLRKKNNTSSIKLPMYQENCYFEELYLRFQAFLATQMGVSYTCLGYIISPAIGATYNPDNYAQNFQKKLDQSMLFTENKFDVDNINSFNHLQAATTGTSAYTYRAL